MSISFSKRKIPVHKFIAANRLVHKKNFSTLILFSYIVLPKKRFPKIDYLLSWKLVNDPKICSIISKYTNKYTQFRILFFTSSELKQIVFEFKTIKRPKLFIKSVNTIFDVAIVKNKSKLTTGMFVCFELGFELIRNQFNGMNSIRNGNTSTWSFDPIKIFYLPSVHFYIKFYVSELLLLNDKYFIIGKRFNA